MPSICISPLDRCGKASRGTGSVMSPTSTKTLKGSTRLFGNAEVIMCPLRRQVVRARPGERAGAVGKGWYCMALPYSGVLAQRLLCVSLQQVL